MPTLRGIHETVLYGDDVPALTRFYQDIVGLRLVATNEVISAALRMPEGDAVLLLFNPRLTDKPGRGVPQHGAIGAGHIAFRIDAGAWPEWATHLGKCGIPIELERDWDRGGRSIYVRDPAGNSVEFIAGRVWPE